jgi:hypothetical protein
MSRDKAISWDLFPDNFCRIFNNREERSERFLNLLGQLWTIPISKLDQIHFKARVVPLNKVHPQIPKKGEFRPIIVQSPIIKLLEMRFYDKLMEYCKGGIVKSQTGFVAGCGTDLNLVRIVERIKETRKIKTGTFGVVFIDFSNAYNTVNREILYKILEKDKILEKQEVQYLRAIHERITISCGGKALSTEAGIHQGSPISPLLFDIYLNELLKKLKSQLDIEDKDIFAYADDLAIIAPKEKMDSIFNLLHDVEAEMNLKVNKKKSGILWIYWRKDKKPTIAHIQDYPVVDTYRYLGVDLDGRGEIQNYFKRMRKKTDFLYYQLIPAQIFLT